MFWMLQNIYVSLYSISNLYIYTVYTLGDQGDQSVR